MKKPIRFAFNDWIFIQMDAEKDIMEHFFRLEMPLAYFEEINAYNFDKDDIELLITNHFKEDIADNNRFGLWFFNKTDEVLTNINLVVSIEELDDVPYDENSTDKYDLQLFANCNSINFAYFYAHKYLERKNIEISIIEHQPIFQKINTIKIGSSICPYTCYLWGMNAVPDKDTIYLISRMLFKIRISSMNLNFMESDYPICDKIGEKIEKIITDGYFKSHPYLKLFFELNKYSYKFHIDWGYQTYDDGVEFYGFIDLCEVNNRIIKFCSNKTMIVECKRNTADAKKIGFSIAELYFALFSTLNELHYKLPDKSYPAAIQKHSALANGNSLWEINIMLHAIELTPIAYSNAILNSYYSISRLESISNDYEIRSDFHMQFFQNVHVFGAEEDDLSRFAKYMCVITVDREWKKLDMNDFINIIERYFIYTRVECGRENNIGIKSIVLLGLFLEVDHKNYVKYLIGLDCRKIIKEKNKEENIEENEESNSQDTENTEDCVMHQPDSIADVDKEEQKETKTKINWNLLLDRKRNYDSQYKRRK